MKKKKVTTRSRKPPAPPEMPLRRKVLIATLVFVVGAAFGRFSLPARVEIKTQTQVVEKVVVQKERAKQTDRTTVIIKTVAPDGTVTERTEIVDKTKVTSDTNKTSDSKSDSSSSKVTEYAKNDWFIRAMAKGQLGVAGPLRYGVGVDRRILGPVYLGVFGYDDKTVGGSVGLSF